MSDAAAERASIRRFVLLPTFTADESTTDRLLLNIRYGYHDPANAGPLISPACDWTHSNALFTRRFTSGAAIVIKLPCNVGRKRALPITLRFVSSVVRRS